MIPDPSAISLAFVNASVESEFILRLLITSTYEDNFFAVPELKCSGYFPASGRILHGVTLKAVASSKIF